ncbi:MAG: PAS domain S-box protein [Deltaproteobacteria bacterium]|nr:PAS domain S-box protein [Deltaproteobacteria bacterium]
MNQRELFLKVLGIVALVEFLVMVILTHTGLPEGILKNLIDTLLLSVLSVPLLYVFVIRDVGRRLSERALLSRTVLKQEMELKSHAERLQTREAAERRSRFYSERLELIGRIGTSVLQDAEIDAVLREAARDLCGLLRTPFCLIRVFGNPDRGIEHAEPGFPPPGSSSPLFQGLPDFRAIFGERGNVAVDDARNDPRHLSQCDSPGRSSLGAYLGVPLCRQDGLLGALVLGFPGPHAWTSDEIATAEAIARQVAIAIHHERMFRDQRELAGRMFSLMNNIPGIVYRGHPDWSVSFIGAEVESVTGFTAAEILGKAIRWNELIHPDDLGTVRDTLREAVRTGKKVLRLEYRIRHRDGSYRWLTDRRQLVYGGRARLLYIDGLALDVTERRGSEESRIRLAMAVEQADETIMITGVDGTIRYVNPAFERVTGYTRDEAVGRNPRFLKSGKHDEAFYREIWDTLSRGEVWTGRIVNRKKNGELFEEDATISPVRDGTGRIINYLAAKRDVTRLVSLEKQVRTAQRMESVGTLAGGIAHDFNNALTGVLGFGEILRLRLAGDPKALADLDEMIRSAERASTLTRQLLAFARRQVIEPVNLSLNGVVNDLLKLLRKVIGEHIVVETSLREDIPSVFADPGQMEQVLMNLCLNARDAMPDGGRLVIETGVMEIDEEYVGAYPYMKRGRYVLLAVSDTGIGMDERTRERVFEPFFTTKRPEKGTGLGLSVVYGIVKQHDGFIHLSSEPGKGTIFRIHLPAVEARPDAKAAPDRTAVRGGNETVLLAEDDESVRKLAERTLRESGYRVLAARNGEEAVGLFRRNDGIALTLLDVVMPRMGGKEVLETIRTLDPKAKVIFMSGYSADTVHESFVLIPGVPVLSKPFGPTALARKVREILDRNDEGTDGA